MIGQTRFKRKVCSVIKRRLNDGIAIGNSTEAPIAGYLILAFCGASHTLKVESKVKFIQQPLAPCCGNEVA